MDEWPTDRSATLLSVFQSDAKTKNEKWNSCPFFKVMRKRKTKSKIQICFSMSCENEKWKWHLNSIFPCHRKTVDTKVHAFVGFKWLCKNDKRNSDLFFKVTVIRKRETKTEIHIRFLKRCGNEIRSSKPFFKVSRKRKTKSKIQICFSMSCENEKWKWHLNSLSPCHRKTVGTKVHALKWNSFYKVEEKRKLKMKFEFHFFKPSKNGWH